MNEIISILCFILFGVLALSLFKKGSDIFSPGRIFLLIWTLAIGLASLKLSRYQFNWSTYSWLMFAISIGSMLLGIFVVYVINIGKVTKNVSLLRDIKKINDVGSKIFFRYIIMLFLAYLVSFIISTVIIGYLPLFTRFPGVTRNDWGIFGFGLFVQSFPAIIFLSILYFIFTKGKMNRKILLGLVIVITFVTYSFLLQRYYIVFALLLCTIAVYYSTSLLKARNVIIISTILITIFFGMSFIRLTGTIINYLYYLSDMRFSVKYAIFTEPYMYIVMNLENFASAVDQIDKYTYGLFTFDFLFALAGLKHTLFEYLSLNEFPYIITNNYNTYTMFFIYYWDFGIIGLAIIPLILGIIFGHTYYKMKRNPNLNTISMYSIFSFVLIFSFFIPIISFLHFVFNLFVIYFTTWLIVKTSK